MDQTRIVLGLKTKTGFNYRRLISLTCQGHHFHIENKHQRLNLLPIGGWHRFGKISQGLLFNKVII